MVENAVTTFALPFGVALNFQVNGRDHVIPMVVEEPSVIAAASNAALVARAGGGFAAEADADAMIGQIQLVDVPDPGAAVERVGAARARILAAAEELTPGLCQRGAGPRDVEVRLVRTPRGETMVVVHVLLDTGDAMGANAVNSLVEGLAPMVAEVAGGTVCLRILSNLADRRLARAAVRVPVTALAREGIDGTEVARRMVAAYEFAAADPYRAATHNKGIMNGIDALAVATGNDRRAIGAGRGGRGAPSAAHRRRGGEDRSRAGAAPHPGVPLVNLPARGRAAGKVILLGEHAVVYGRPALVASLPLGLAAEVATSAGAPRLESDHPDLDADPRAAALVAEAAAILDLPGRDS